MRNFFVVILFAAAAIILFLSCGYDPTKFGRSENVDKTSNISTEEVASLKATILSLQGTAAMIDAFSTGNFASCSSNLAAFEKKVCQIAQSETAEGNLQYFSTLADLSKMLQNQLFGENCITATDPGCPILGSVLSKLSAIEASSGSQATAITALQSSVATIQSQITGLNARLNNFNGTASSLETVITGMQTDITSIKSRLDTLERTLNPADLWKPILLCNNISDSGPVYESLLISGDNKQAVAYVSDGGRRGLAVVSTAGTTGNLMFITRLNTKVCNFKIYDRGATLGLKVCWKNTDRSAVAADIDAVCGTTANAITTNCTCQGY